MGELWKEVKGCNGLYLVSNMGRVKRIYKTKPSRLLKQVVNHDGYLAVSVSDGKGNIKNKRVHRLVAETFIENPKNYPVVNHIDENKKNNALDNLEWCSVKYNTNYNGASKKRGLRKRKPITQLTLDGQVVRVWDSRVEIEQQMNVSGGNITSCATGKRKSAYGYKWRYATPDEMENELWNTK